MRTFQFIWKSGKIETGKGENVAKAFSSLGYGAGAMAALDYYREIQIEK